jgi:hypothetical protein
MEVAHYPCGSNAIIYSFLNNCYRVIQFFKCKGLTQQKIKLTLCQKCMSSHQSWVIFRDKIFPTTLNMDLYIPWLNLQIHTLVNVSNKPLMDVIIIIPIKIKDIC